jgi:hypothetical protein
VLCTNAPFMDDRHDNISLGDNVVIDTNGEKFAFEKLCDESTLSIGGFHCPTAPLVGAPFGASFLVNRAGELERTYCNPHDQIEEAVETEKVCLYGGAPLRSMRI